MFLMSAPAPFTCAQVPETGAIERRVTNSLAEAEKERQAWATQIGSKKTQTDGESESTE